MIRDILGFIRLEKSIASAIVALFGYSLFNPIGFDVVFASLSAFCAAASFRAYNNLKDKDEDAVNRKKINPYVGTTTGHVIILSLFFTGLYLAFIFSVVSLVSYIAVMTLTTVYSLFRLKSHFLVKNSVSGTMLTLLFLVGVGFVSVEVALYSGLVFLFIFAASLVSDIMDYDGDKAAGHKSISVVLGLHRTKNLVYLLLFILSAAVVQLRLYNIILMVVGAAIIVICTATGRPQHVHKLCGSIFLLNGLYVML